MRRHHDRRAMRFTIDYRTFTKHVARTENLLDHPCAAHPAGDPGFTSTTDNQEHGIRRVPLLKNDGTFRILSERRLGKKPIKIASWQKGKERMRLERLSVHSEGRRGGSITVRQGILGRRGVRSKFRKSNFSPRDYHI